MKLIFAALSQVLARPALCALVVIAFTANIAQANYNGTSVGEANPPGRCGDGVGAQEEGERRGRVHVVNKRQHER